MAGQVLRYDPDRGGAFYDDPTDDSDPYKMLGVEPPTLNANPAGNSTFTPSAPATAAAVPAAGAAPSAAALSMGAVAPWSAATEPVTKTTSKWSTEKPVETVRDVIAEGQRATARETEANLQSQLAPLAKQQKLNEATAEEKNAGVYADELKKNQAAADARDAAMKASASRISALQEQASKVPTEDLFARATTGQKVVAGLGVLFARIAQGIAGHIGGENPALENIHRLIAEDKADRDGRLARIAKDIEHLQGPAREQAMKEYQAAVEKNAADRAAMLNKLGSEAKAVAARTGSEQAQIEGDKLAAQTQALAAKEVQEHLDKVRVKTTAGGEKEDVIPKGGGNTDTTVQDLSGKDIGIARSPTEATKVHEAAANTNGFLASLQRYKDHLLKYGRTFDDDPAVQKERTMLRNLVVGQMTGPMKSGVLNAGEGERYNDMIDTGLRSGGPEAAKAVDVLMRETKSGYNTLAHGLARIVPGAEPVPPSMAQPPAGQTAPGGFGLRPSTPSTARPVSPPPVSAPMPAPAATPTMTSTSPAAALARAAAPTPKAAPTPAKSPAQSAQEWLDANPNDPDAPAVRAKLKRMGF